MTTHYATDGCTPPHDPLAAALAAEAEHFDVVLEPKLRDALADEARSFITYEIERRITREAHTGYGWGSECHWRSVMRLAANIAQGVTPTGNHAAADRPISPSADDLPNTSP